MHIPFLQSATTRLALLLGLTAVVTDLRNRRIPNWLTLPAICAGLINHYLHHGLTGVMDSSAAMLLCGVTFLVFHLAGGMGAGDVKLIAAEASILGLRYATSMLLMTLLCGGVLASFTMLRRRIVKRTIANALTIAAHHARYGLTNHKDLNIKNIEMVRLPYAVAIAGGVLLSLLIPAMQGAAR